MLNLPYDYKKSIETGMIRRMLASDDIIPNTFLPYVLIKHKGIDYAPIMKYIRTWVQGGKEDPYFMINRDGKYYASYPIITGLFAIPIYVIPILMDKIPGLGTQKDILNILALGRISAAFYTALSCSIFYLILKKLSKTNNQYWRLIFTIFYALGTTTYSISSRGMWMHTISQLLISIEILVLIEALKNKKLIDYAGIILGIAVLTRLTNAVVAIVIAAYVFFYYRDRFIKFAIYTLPTVFILFWYNNLAFGSPFVEGYQSRGDFGWSTPILYGLAGFLVSPGRSLLFISPPLIFSFFEIYRIFTIKRNDRTKEDNLILFLGISFILSLLLMSKWSGWHGANAFGYRMLTEYLSIISLLAFLATEKMEKTGKILVTILIIYSIYVNANAVLFRKGRCDADHNWTIYCLMPPSRPPQY